MSVFLRLLLVIASVVVVALLLGYIWSEFYPPIEATPEEIRAQADVLRSVATPCLAVVGPLLGGVVSIGYLRRRTKLKKQELSRLRGLYIHALALIILSIIFGIFFLLNLSLKPVQMKRLPMSIFSVRTDLFLQAIFLVVGLCYTFAVLIGREK